MNTLFNEYLTGDDREVAIMEAEYDAEMAKLDLLLETVQSTLKVNMLDAEAKVFAENGTYDDLTMLYTEATEEANKKSGNIFTAMFAAIGKFFARIGAFFRERFGKQEAIPETTQCDARLDSDMNAFTKCWNQLKAGVANLKNGNISAGAKKIMAITIPTFAVLAGGAVTYVAVSKAQLKQHTEVLEEAQQQIEAASTSAQNLLSTGKAVAEFTGLVKADDGKEGDGKSFLQKVIDKLKEFGSKILAFIKKIWGWIKGKVEGMQNNRVRKKMRLKAGAETPKLAAKNKEPAKAEEKEEKEYITGDVKLSKEEQKKAHDDAKKASGKRRLSKDAKAKAEADAAAAKKKASNDKIASIVNDQYEDEFGFGESAQLLDVDPDTAEFLFESELSETEMNELNELFADL